MAAMPSTSQHPDGLRTYRGWQIEGRTIRKGEKADHYLVSPCGTRYKGLFRPDQTDELGPDMDEEGWTEVITSAEREARKPQKVQDHRVPIHIRYDSKSTQVAIWVGNAQYGINTMRKAKFWFNRSSHRWIGKRADIRALVATLAADPMFKFKQIMIDTVEYDYNYETGMLEKTLVI